MRSALFYFFFLFTLVANTQDVKTYTYAVKAKDSLKLDVYTPKSITKDQRLPVIIWMHGGGFAGGNRFGTEEMKFMNYITSKDYIGVSISYRLLRKGAKTGFGCNCPKEDKLFTFASAIEDFLDASKYLIAHNDKLNIDTTKLIAAGSSAGAETILNAVFMNDYFIEDTSHYNEVSFAGVVSFAGALLDVSYITEANAIPTVLFHGVEDAIVPYSTAAHHLCHHDDPGYLILDGSKAIADQLDQLEKAYYLHKVKSGKHEVAAIAFEEMEAVFEFLNKTILNSELIQTKKTVD
ncbi:alpha/beta hydrolase [uncultured Psychroserpens sp.]|uniref:alpha/beta hydrolase n=1 Tax=uncultured Psychroserpens sp. TaxID=255436 RepID=UPI00261BCA72|nr:alpha/beta hydrolase [uncultured Psychroserpens sp.]